MACYFLEELLTRGRVCVLTPEPVSLEDHDRVWGTRLAGSELEVKVLHSPLLSLLRRLRVPTVRLEIHLLCRAAKKLRSRFTYCTVIPGELDLGAPCLQVLYYPFLSMEQLKGEVRSLKPFWWRLLAHLNIWASQWLHHWQDSRISESFIVVISRYIGALVQDVYHSTHNEVLFPPPAALPAVESKDRRMAVLAIGRITRVKGWTELVSLVDKVRARGHELGLTIVGFVEDPEYHRELELLRKTRADWFRLRADTSREELTAEIAEHEFGIHIMEGEHYGMGVAEMMLGGCLTLVHDSGGQVEIVTEPELRFTDLDDGAEKLSRLLDDPDERERLKASQCARRRDYSLEAFRESFHRCMDAYENWLNVNS